MRDGVAALDAVYSVQWLELSDGYKLKALHHLEGTSFFQTVRSFMVGSAGLYNQPLVWRYFGYEGPAWEFGGYLDRGFDDIAWVPTE
ncbi:MAG: hypothetical protein D6736_11065 [Nitrospinota bacterium]|nr:MAG: hypothetical protein D6736_11065 [Nitrospinota bacterium]